MSQELRLPLVSYTVSAATNPNYKILSYYCGDVLLMDLEIDQNWIKSADPLMLVQLLVTPHEHMALLDSWRNAAKANPEFSELVSQTERILQIPG